MPNYEVRLEAQDGSGHFRVAHLEADDKAAAKRRCERLELRRVLFELSGEQQAELLTRYEAKDLAALPRPAAFKAAAEAKAAFRALETPDRARLHAHYQDEPYKVVSVKEL